ncbi:DUF1295 domain-containing protein [Saccharopolyspora cebuensis]|uniref:DUF1295 domain-containing protein n=1 Tax=Saccharopolyspora cebuensis TaxID=418759 RepID=A0ABV4CGQ1_9PSEU
MNAFLPLIALVTALLVVTATFGIAHLRGKYDTIDTAWGAGFAVIAAVSLVVGGISPVAVALTAVWGVRLSWHLHRRNAGGPEDRRYAAMLRKGKRPVLRMYARTYLTQAVAMWFVSLPVQFSAPGAGAFTVAGVLVWLVGFGFEVVGDEQLRRFRADPANEGGVLDTGLWRYTRHPNYFGDACVWWGLYLIACQHWPGPLTVLSPLLMTWLLARGTGKPMLEKDIEQRRPGYADYVARTSGFVPLPPKRS